MGANRGMEEPTPAVSGQVALLIDFENLVRGLVGEDSVDCEQLFRLAEEYGRVLLANAYADWRRKDVNQYQTELYRLGADLVHVFGKYSNSGFKNAVDVKMAVDAISTVSSLPHIDVFVIASGDRDFIHVLKALRRHGKTIIGVSPRASSSDDFATLCDRFVHFETLAGVQEPADLNEVRVVLRRLLAAHPDGLKGAQIKPLLRRELSPTFDEASYGFSRLSDLLRALHDTIRIEVPNATGDVTVLLADKGTAPAGDANGGISVLERAIQSAKLSDYRFERDATRRRRILQRLYRQMTASEVFTWADVLQGILSDPDEDTQELSVTILSKYRTVILQARGFIIEPDQEDLSHREKLARLDPAIASDEDLVRRYETSIVFKLLTAAEELSLDLSREDLARALGLGSDNAALEYCDDLGARATTIRTAMASDSTDEPLRGNR
jgi:uncharacterized LabA/DUF88 family protein